MKLYLNQRCLDELAANVREAGAPSDDLTLARLLLREMAYMYAKDLMIDEADVDRVDFSTLAGRGAALQEASFYLVYVIVKACRPTGEVVTALERVLEVVAEEMSQHIGRGAPKGN